MHDHLHERKFGQERISDIDMVRNDFSEIGMYFEKCESLNPGENRIDNINFTINNLIYILKKLSVLSGARAVFRGNSIELLTHFQLFQKLISH